MPLKGCPTQFVVKEEGQKKRKNKKREREKGEALILPTI